MLCLELFCLVGLFHDKHHITYHCKVSYLIISHNIMINYHHISYDHLVELCLHCHLLVARRTSKVVDTPGLKLNFKFVFFYISFLLDAPGLKLNSWCCEVGVKIRNATQGRLGEWGRRNKGKEWRSKDRQMILWGHTMTHSQRRNRMKLIGCVTDSVGNHRTRRKRCDCKCSEDRGKI